MLALWVEAEEALKREYPEYEWYVHYIDNVYVHVQVCDPTKNTRCSLDYATRDIKQSVRDNGFEMAIELIGAKLLAWLVITSREL